MFMNLMRKLGITGVQFITALGFERYYSGYNQEGREVDILWDLTTNNIEVSGEGTCSVYQLKEAAENLELEIV